MDVINSKKKKNEPMPYQCEICQQCNSVEKSLRDIKDAKNNECFEQRLGFRARPAIMAYAPFTNSKKEIETTCKHFSHIKLGQTW